MEKQGKVIIFSAPSGSGKSTIVHALLERIPNLEFSISATSRAPRGEEKNGIEYYFLSSEEFARRSKEGEFLEWEEVYAGTCYGTLNSEIDRIWQKGNTIIFDIDVKGGINLKQKFRENALALFIMPPSVEELERRLQYRGTETPEAIQKRIDRAQLEISYAGRFDKIIINDDLAKAIDETEQTIKDFLKNG